MHFSEEHCVGSVNGFARDSSIMPALPVHGLCTTHYEQPWEAASQYRLHTYLQSLSAETQGQSGTDIAVCGWKYVYLVPACKKEYVDSR